ncbi:hypothetical protein ABIE85_007144 [Bradyrhizobium diazoefficiens]|nr:MULTISPECIES: hypothetical protein [Bradyrhizobium]MBR0945482.1 hypothetical protein [Bradyrhizobium liaoningense]MBR1001113.1 hypothetical protein [Bradyrhizobium liaoningense]MCP1747198.1 hypothetical protein [Bradyrhizobium japonicum]MCP1865544.1 hypothetical protein [Bradyrhizobium japonicum]MCP1895685.1 hypothetical protein [Bradyrhizobium japonicum]
MDENWPPIPTNDFLLPSASERTSADDDPPQTALTKSAECSAAYYRNKTEVRDGFLIALRAMELADFEQHSEPVTLPVGSAKP